MRQSSVSASIISTIRITRWIPIFSDIHLVDGVYQEIAFVDERLPSLVLGLELGERDGVFGLYDPRRSVWLQPLEEQVIQADARAEQEAQAAR